MLGAALPMGIGLAHHVTMVYMLPAAFVYLMVRRPSFFVAWLTNPVVRLVRLFKRRRRGRLAGWWGFPVACLVGFLPLLSYGFLIWANNHTTGVPWGDVHGWDNLYAHFTGKQYQGFMRGWISPRTGSASGIVPVVFDEQFLPMGTVLFFVGRRRRVPAHVAARALLPRLHGPERRPRRPLRRWATTWSITSPRVYACAVFMGLGPRRR